MAQYNLDIKQVGLTNIPDFIVEAKTLDAANANGEETYVYFTDAPENFAYYLQHPQGS